MSSTGVLPAGVVVRNGEAYIVGENGSTQTPFVPSSQAGEQGYIDPVIFKQILDNSCLDAMREANSCKASEPHSKISLAMNLDNPEGVPHNYKTNNTTDLFSFSFIKKNDPSDVLDYVGMSLDQITNVINFPDYCAFFITLDSNITAKLNIRIALLDE